MAIFDKFFNYDKTMNKVKHGKGVKKKKITDKEKYSLKSFFIIYKEKFWKISVVNMMFILLCLPALCTLLAYVGVFKTQTLGPANPLYPVLHGTYLFNPNLVTSNLVGVFGAQVSHQFNNTATYILYGIGMLTFFTFGFANVGMTYVLRAFTRGDFIYIWHDFFGAIKKNFFPALLTGILDLTVIILLIYSTYFYYVQRTDFLNHMLFFVMIAISVIYFIMRFYIYLLLITFKLSPLKLVKNALIFTMIGLKRNIAALIGIIIILLINVLLITFFLPFGILFPLFLLISNCTFMSCFASYYSIKKYMVDPYYSEHPDENPEENHGEQIFIDRG